MAWLHVVGTMPVRPLFVLRLLPISMHGSNSSNSSGGVLGRCTTPRLHGGPRISDVWLFVYQYFGVRGCQRCTVVVEGPVELGVCREAWVYSQASHEVHLNQRLWVQLVP
jgi:hypothetical protein